MSCVKLGWQWSLSCLWGFDSPSALSLNYPVHARNIYKSNALSLPLDYQSLLWSFFLAFSFIFISLSLSLWPPPPSPNTYNFECLSFSRASKLSLSGTLLSLSLSLSLSLFNLVFPTCFSKSWAVHLSPLSPSLQTLTPNPHSLLFFFSLSIISLFSFLVFWKLNTPKEKANDKANFWCSESWTHLKKRPMTRPTCNGRFLRCFDLWKHQNYSRGWLIFGFDQNLFGVRKTENT